MKIAFYGTKAYDKIWFEPLGKDYGFDIRFIEQYFWQRVTTQSAFLSMTT